MRWIRSFPPQSEELTEYDEKMVRLYIERITVYDDKFMVSFKAGIDIDIQRYILGSDTQVALRSCFLYRMYIFALVLLFVAMMKLNS